jgi:hypothetical protein
VIVTSITELPTQAPATNLTATTQLSDQSPKSFSDSLFSATKASPESGILQNPNPKGNHDPKSNADNASTPGTVANHRSTQMQDVAQPSVVPQHAIPDLQAQVTNPLVAHLQQTFDPPTGALDVRGFATETAPAVDLTAQTGVAEAVGVQAGRSALQADSPFARFAVQPKTASTGTISRPLSNLSATVAPATFASTQPVAQNTSTLATSGSLLFSPSASSRQGSLDAARGVAPYDLTNSAQGAVPAATTANVPGLLSNQSSNASLNTPTAASPITLASVAAGGTQSTFGQFMNSSSTTATSKEMQGVLSTDSTIQSADSNAVPADPQKSAQSAETDSAPASSPIASNASPQIVDHATPESLVHSFWSAVQHTVSSTSSDGVATSGIDRDVKVPSIPLSNRNQNEETVVASNVNANTIQAAVPKSIPQAAPIVARVSDPKIVADEMPSTAVIAGSAAQTEVKEPTQDATTDLKAGAVPMPVQDVATYAAANGASVRAQASIPDPMADNSAVTPSNKKSNAFAGAVPSGIQDSIPNVVARSVASAYSSSAEGAVNRQAPASAQDSSAGQMRDSIQNLPFTATATLTAMPVKERAVAVDATQTSDSAAASNAVPAEAKAAEVVIPGDVAVSPTRSSTSDVVVDAIPVTIAAQGSSSDSSAVTNSPSSLAPSTAPDPSLVNFANTVPNIVQSTVQIAVPQEPAKPAPVAESKIAATAQDAPASAPQAVTLVPEQRVILSQTPSLPLDVAPAQNIRAALSAAIKGSVAFAANAIPATRPVVPRSVASTPKPAAPNTDAGHIGVTAQPSSQSNMGETVAPSSNINPTAKPVTATASDRTAESKSPTSDAAGVNQYSQSKQDHEGTQAGSQTVTSSDPTQASLTSQGQSILPADVNNVIHTPAATSPAALGVVSNVPAAAGTSVARDSGSAAKTPEAAGSAAAGAVAAPAPPAINTAKLIQSASQSEMRVGMRSNEFGNISINTSVTKGLVSAQISLDHGELAKTLTTHLPEMQTRLGSNQAVDVRIDMNGQGQGTGTSSGMSNGSSDHSRESRGQAGSSGSAFSRAGLAEPASSVSGSVIATGNSGTSSRLDITV